MTAPMDVRFWRKVDKDGPTMPHMDTPCWTWTAALDGHGYGQIGVPGGKRNLLAHRYSAMLHFGMFDRRAWILHRCDNSPCVRPDHLYLGDRGQNAADRLARAGYSNAEKIACVNGHPFDESNTYRYEWAGKTKRACRRCKTERKSHNPG